MRSLRALLKAALDRHLKLLAFSILALVSLIAYANSYPNSFHYDDLHGIVRNPNIRDLGNIPTYFADPSSLSPAGKGDWRPVLQTTFALNYFMGGLDPKVFRLFNLVFHIGSAFLIFLIVAEISRAFPTKLFSEHRKSVLWPAIIPAALFAVHTANTDTVNYIWARSSLLAAFFFLLAFYCFLRGPLSGRREGSIVWHFGGIVSFALGLGTKATVIGLPAILVFYELLFLQRPRRNPIKLFWKEPRRFNKYLPVIAVCLIYIVLRGFLLPRTFTRVVGSTSTGISSITYLLTQFRAWVYYIGLFLWPDSLIVDFPGFGWSHTLWDTRVLLSLGIIALILVLAWYWRRTEPIITFFVIWFFIALLPEASFIPLSEPVTSYRPYLANAGLSVVVSMLSLKGWTWIWRKFSKGQDEESVLHVPAKYNIAYSIILVIVLGALTVTTMERNRVWRGEETLWSDVLRKDPTNPRAYMSLGLQFLKKKDHGKAHEMLDKAVQVGRNSDAYMLRGHFHFVQGRADQALADFTHAIQLGSRSPLSFFFRAELYRTKGQFDIALADYHSALKVKPKFTNAYLGIARVHFARDEIAAATEACRRMTEINPKDRRGHQCLRALLKRQKPSADSLNTLKGP